MAEPGTSLIVGVCVIMVSLFAATFIVAHAGHDCCGDGCPVCLQIQWARDFCRQLRHVPLRLDFFPALMAVKGPGLRGPVFDPLPVTSVTLKVKISA
ncbi:MAG: hypothetical protein LBD78_03620 [Spirochaetaceae bacterium]|nr:hypothetical protein [Spirochaetaceae bacterium]